MLVRPLTAVMPPPPQGKTRKSLVAKVPLEIKVHLIYLIFFGRGERVVWMR